MEFLPLKTRKFTPPQDKGKLFGLLNKFIPKLKEKDVVVVTSKIVAIDQGRFVPARSMAQKLKLIKREADGYLPGHVHGLTLKDTVLTPYAGIDRTNSNNHYILWPDRPHQAARKIWLHLKQRHCLKKLGVIISDSFCLPLRWGHMGISIGFWGFHPNRSYAGSKDIFGNKIIAGNSNLVDALSSLSGAVMGEGREQTPLLIIRGFKRLKFTSRSTKQELPAGPKKDMYSPLLRLFRTPKRIHKQPAQNLLKPHSVHG